jgi:hypothetical protein
MADENEDSNTGAIIGWSIGGIVLAFIVWIFVFGGGDFIATLITGVPPRRFVRAPRWQPPPGPEVHLLPRDPGYAAAMADALARAAPTPYTSYIPKRPRSWWPQFDVPDF